MKSKHDTMTMLEYEHKNIQEGRRVIAGVDEVGRGPLAGPVVVCCCVMPLNDEDIIQGVNDSKKVSEKNREILFDKIKEKAIDYQIEILDEKTIDEINILQATKQCMVKAIENINKNYHLWILDIMLGDDVSGYDIIKKIREINEVVPVIFTSARDKDLDKIIGLELGSDDYITKPFSTKELVLRVNNIIKRVYKNEVNKITYDKYSINLDKRIVLKGDKEITLTTLEFDLLSMFVTNKNKSFSRDDILNNIWGENYFGTDRVVDDLVRRLRKKMPLLNINTIYGFGYRLT